MWVFLVICLWECGINFCLLKFIRDFMVLAWGLAEVVSAVKQLLFSLLLLQRGRMHRIQVLPTAIAVYVQPLLSPLSVFVHQVQQFCVPLGPDGLQVQPCPELDTTCLAYASDASIFK